MKKFFKVFLKILKWIGIALLALIVILLIVRFFGKRKNNTTPEGGINESMYIDINGQEQWINIYGEDMNNPVMLYLHGGPGQSSSAGDYVVLRKLAKDYTVVNWDQRNCGKTWSHDPKNEPITAEILRSDILEVVKYVLDYTGKEKLTLLGNSWGTLYGCDFALDHPEYVECIISTSQVVDAAVSDAALRDLYLEWSENDPEFHELAEKFDPNLNYSDENNEIYFKLAEKYTLDGHIPVDENAEGDMNVEKAVFFNPYYSIGELFDLLRYTISKKGYSLYTDFMFTGGCYETFTLMDRTEYEMPIYIIEGNMDYIALHTVAKDYYDRISAPDKDFIYIDGGHNATFTHSEELAEYVHDIAERQKTLQSEGKE